MLRISVGMPEDKDHPAENRILYFPNLNRAARNAVLTTGGKGRLNGPRGFVLNRPVIFRIVIMLTVCLAQAGSAFGQETASRFFERVSERYESIEDYTADLKITKGDEEQFATVWYKNPDKLRLDFSEPAEMVIAVGEETLQVWVPSYGVTFSQPLKRNSQAQMAGLSGSRGLELLSKYYTISYNPSPTPVPLDAGSSEMVVKLKAEWKTTNEGFRRLELSIDSDLRIRRIIGVTTVGETIMFDFSNMVLNKGIPDTRFDYESPPTGNTIENFLFDPES